MKKILILIAVFSGVFSLSLAAEEIKAEKTEKKTEKSYWDKAKEYYQKVSEKGLEAGEEAKIWIKQDFEKIGDWEYKIISISSLDLVKMEKELNELGNDRWECFWQQKEKKSFIFFFKRQKVSILQKVPVGTVLKGLQDKD